jgi:hypothetical protein
MPVSVLCFEAKVTAYSVQLNSDHKWKIFANLRRNGRRWLV